MDYDFDAMMNDENIKQDELKGEGEAYQMNRIYNEEESSDEDEKFFKNADSEKYVA